MAKRTTPQAEPAPIEQAAAVEQAVEPERIPIDPSDDETPSAAPALMVPADAKIRPVDVLRMAAKQSAKPQAKPKQPSVTTLPNGIVIRNN